MFEGLQQWERGSTFQCEHRKTFGGRHAQFFVQKFQTLFRGDGGGVGCAGRHHGQHNMYTLYNIVVFGAVPEAD